MIITNPLLLSQDPRISGKKSSEHENQAKLKEDVALMHTFMKDFYEQRGTSVWTDSTEFDFKERR